VSSPSSAKKRKNNYGKSARNKPNKLRKSSAFKNGNKQIHQVLAILPGMWTTSLDLSRRVFHIPDFPKLTGGDSFASLEQQSFPVQAAPLFGLSTDPCFYQSCAAIAHATSLSIQIHS
ncbi:Hypothetical predicted protein, partial [Mytilus galloprovincialis]